MDLLNIVVRAGREAARVRVVGAAQARLLSLRLQRRSSRDSVVDEALALYRRGALKDTSLVPLCRQLNELHEEIERLETTIGQLQGEPASRPSTPIITEVDERRRG